MKRLSAILRRRGRGVRPRPPVLPRRGGRVAARRRRQDRARARRRHRQADPRDGRPGPRGLRDREGRRDARRSCSERVPEVSAKVAGAEEIPANDRSVDVVIAAQAFHWFDHDVALPEMARVLRPAATSPSCGTSSTSASRGCASWSRSMGEHSATSELAGASSQGSELFGERREREVRLLAGRQPRHPRRHRRLPLLRRLAARGRARGQARRGARAVRRLRPRPRRHAAALRRRVLPREGHRPA